MLLRAGLGWLCCAFCLSLGWAAEPVSLSFEAAAAELKQGGYVVLMRHAQTEPGVGDPANLRLSDCSTQRNLSVQGREHSRQLGEGLRRLGVQPSAVFSSAWCRCLDTGAEAFTEGLGSSSAKLKVEVLPIINSFFGDAEAGRLQTVKLRDWVIATPLKDAALGANKNKLIWLVTHQVNITALTGYYVQMGEAVALKLPVKLPVSSGATLAPLTPAFRFIAAGKN